MELHVKKYVIWDKKHRNEVKMLAVDPEIHGLVKAYALNKGISIAEATYELLGIGLKKEFGLENVEKNEEW